MTQVLPSAFAFHFAFPVPHIAGLPKSGSRLLQLPDECRIAWPGAEIAGVSESLLDLRIAWNAAGLGVSIDVGGKQHPPVSQPTKPSETEGLQVWIDTRDTQTIHRANRFCHWFCMLPTGSGPKKLSPSVHQLSIARAVEEAPLGPSEVFKTASGLRADGYWLEAWFPASTLTGFDHETSPRLGFYALLKDVEHGDIPLTVGSEFPFAADPSLWQTLEMQE